MHYEKAPRFRRSRPDEAGRFFIMHGPKCRTMVDPGEGFKLPRIPSGVTLASV